MTVCYNQTDVDVRIDALRVSSAQRTDAKLFSRCVGARGVSQVDVTMDRDTVYLLYKADGIAVNYRAEPSGERCVKVVTSRDSEHDDVFSVPPKAYGLIAAMLLART